MFDTTVIKIVRAVFHELSKTDFQGFFGHKKSLIVNIFFEIICRAYTLTQNTCFIQIGCVVWTLKLGTDIQSTFLGSAHPKMDRPVRISNVNSKWIVLYAHYNAVSVLECTCEKVK